MVKPEERKAWHSGLLFGVTWGDHDEPQRCVQHCVHANVGMTCKCMCISLSARYTDKYTNLTVDRCVTAIHLFDHQGHYYHGGGLAFFLGMQLLELHRLLLSQDFVVESCARNLLAQRQADRAEEPKESEMDNSAKCA